MVVETSPTRPSAKREDQLYRQATGDTRPYGEVSSREKTEKVYQALVSAYNDRVLVLRQLSPRSYRVDTFTIEDKFRKVFIPIQAITKEDVGFLHEAEWGGMIPTFEERRELTEQAIKIIKNRQQVEKLREQLDVLNGRLTFLPPAQIPSRIS